MFLTLKRALRRGIARSWWLSRLWYRRFGLRVEGRPADEVWYFAFGANMHDSAFRGRRRMHPIEWRPGRIRDYRLRFNLEGRPRGKAAPANVEPSPGAKVWGVLYKIGAVFSLGLFGVEDATALAMVTVVMAANMLAVAVFGGWGLWNRHGPERPAPNIYNRTFRLLASVISASNARERLDSGKSTGSPISAERSAAR